MWLVGPFCNRLGRQNRHARVAPIQCHRLPLWCRAVEVLVRRVAYGQQRLDEFGFECGRHFARMVVRFPQAPGMENRLQDST